MGGGSVSAPDLRIPMDMAKVILRTLQRVHGRVLCDEDRAVALTTGDALYEIATEAQSPECPHPGVEVQPPLHMRIIIGETVHELDVHQMPVVGDTVICGSHYTVGAVTWYDSMLTADVIAGPGTGGWGRG